METLMLAMWSIDFQSITLCLDYKKANHRLYWEEPKEVHGKKNTIHWSTLLYPGLQDLGLPAWKG